jgi:hypothetical protein
VTSRRNSKPRRQSFDIAVLCPSRIRQAARNDFDHGLIRASVAVELGLDYTLRHLEGDIDKLTRNTTVAHPYIVHFSRKRTRLSEWG